MNLQEEIKPYYEVAIDKYKSDNNFQKRVNYANARKKYSVDEKMIMYSSFYGRGMCCNPYALFCYMYNDVRFSQYVHVWVLDKLKNHKAEITMYKGDKNVIFVEFESEDYFMYLAKAKYLINNSTEQVYFSKKDEQVLLNTWHGTPLKTMGFDIPGGGSSIGNTLRNFLMDDFLLSSNSLMTKMYKKAYKLDNIYEGTIIETGYPRCDTLYKTDKKEFCDKLNSWGINVDANRKIVLYAPTWKGVKFGDPNTDISKDLQFIEKMYEYLDPSEYQVLFKPHQAVYKRMLELNLSVDKCIPAYVDANEILSITDILISDYSSIFFDFLVTRRPILFYIPDLEEYQEERGLYYSVESLPGPITADREKIGEWLKEISENIDSYKKQFKYENYENAVNIFVSKEDGKVCERVVNRVFFGEKTDDINLEHTKKKILMHVDTLKPNGITSAAINMLRGLDYEKYDVSLVANVPNNASDVWNKIPSEVRAFCRVGTIVTTLEEFAIKEYCNDNAIIISDDFDAFPKNIFELEFKRTYGDCKFDYILNYSGYSGYWSNIYYTQKNSKNFIWMHADLKSELDNRIVDGVKIFAKSLPQVFKHYKNMYKIVGCSEASMKINRENLSDDDTYDKFTFMRNMIDYKRIIDCKDDGVVLEIDGNEFLAINDEQQECFCRTISMVPLPEKNNINFVTVGRLSIEKNHENLIKAFKRINDEVPNTRLYILGDGPLKGELRMLINRLNLNGKVILTGNLDNPFYIENRCNCFILPSFYEGMPMVLLEARTLKLPIIVSNFTSVTDCSYENGQLIIEMQENDIYNGMKAYISGNVPNEFEFDPVNYNKECIAEFERILE